MMQTRATGKKDYRAAIERELRARLDMERAPAPTVATPLAGIALVCLKCRATSDADARFCTSCGEAFNAMVVSRTALRPQA